MSNSTISIFGNKIFSEILIEMKLFSNYKIKYYDNLDLCINENKKKDRLVVFCVNDQNKNLFNEITINDCPTIFVGKTSVIKNLSTIELKHHVNIPFKILDFKKKIVDSIAQYRFKKNSLIYLKDYIIDKNERKIKKNNLELQLSEKEINFLVLFTENKDPISKNLVLNKVWNYSSESETHTVETHIHRLRKKILEKFGDNNFIKNKGNGYYI